MGFLIGITGGIGSGKSVVAKILQSLGYHVYDCDQEAKRLIDNDETILREIHTSISAESIKITSKGIELDRKKLAEAVFNDDEKLKRLNELVHNVVKSDLISWVSEMKTTLDNNTLFVETAILYESGFDYLVNEVWNITAPPELRLKRAIARGMSKSDAESRIKVQDSKFISRLHPNTKVILNDGMTPILPVIIDYLQDINS